MISKNLDSWSSSFTMSDFASQQTVPRKEVFRPEITHCPLCQTVPWVYKTIPDRKVITLGGVKQIDEIQTYCPNPECPGRGGNQQAGSERSFIFTSQKLREWIFPHMRYGLDVILEVGRRFKSDPKPGRDIQTEILRDYGLWIPLATLYRHKDRYEALCKGVIAEHREEISEKLRSQPIFLIIYDATEQNGSQKLYRAIDFLSGFCLGTCLTAEKDKDQLLRWRRSLYNTYGIPDYIVSDREDALQADRTKEPVVPHQICWSHVLLDIWEVFFETWRQRATKFLQKTGYRAQMRAIQSKLDIFPGERETIIQPAVRRLLQVFIPRVPGRSNFKEPVQHRLKALQEALSLVHSWTDALKGVKRSDYQDEALFKEYRQLQTQLSPAEWTHFVTHVLPTQDAAVRALYELQSLLETINASKDLKKLLTEFKLLEDEFNTLRSWLLEAKIRRNQASGWLEKEPTTPAENRLHKLITRQTVKDQKILESIPKSLHAWQWKHGEPDIPLQDQAKLTLQRLLTRWLKKDIYKKRFHQAANKIARYFDDLLIFLCHVAIPVTNQVIETDNGRLKSLWRRSSGGQDRAYFVDYHGESDSSTLNFHPDKYKASPLELLGFARHQLERWLTTCPYERYLEARQTMETSRQPRRDLLRASRQSLKIIFQQETIHFLNHGKTLLQLYLGEGIT